jgi:Flp pilus assembly protein TadG
VRKIAQSSHVPDRVRSRARRILAITREERGQSLLEFALVFPLLMTTLLGILVFGVAYSNYLTLTNGTFLGTQALSISRGQDTTGLAYNDPCQTTYLALHAASPTLNTSNLKFTITVTPASGSAQTFCTSTANPACKSDSSYLVSGSEATVTVTYPCNLQMFEWNPVPNCNLSASTTEVIQ